MSEKHLPTEAEDADGTWMVQDGPEAAKEQSYLKPRHLYMIALGGK